MMFSTRSTCIALLVAGIAFTTSQAASAFAETDPTFNPASIAGWSCDYDIVSLPDDSTFVSAYNPSINQQSVLKMGSDGNRDPSWGQDGIALLTSNHFAPKLLALPGDGLMTIHDTIVHFNPNGTVDTSFGGGGASPSVTSYGQVQSAALQSDGSIIVLGFHTVIDAYRGAITTTAFTRITPQGHRDTRFGADGYLNLTVASGSTVYAWAIGADGSAEVATFRTAANGDVVPQLLRLTDGALGPSVTSVTGRVLPQHGLANWLSPVANVDAFGNVLIATSKGLPADPAGVRVTMFDRDGQRNPQFGAGGTAFVRVSGIVATIISVHPKSLWRTADGGWLVLAQLDDSSGGFFPATYEHTTRAVRLLANGSADPAFTQGVEVGGYQNKKFVRLGNGKLVRSDNSSTGCKLLRQMAEAPRIEGVMVEYYQPQLDHYFMTLAGFESALLDRNVTTMGWLRTGQTFGAWAPERLPGTKRLCRFYGDLTAGPNSHFYTPEGAECDGLRAQEAATPIGQGAWRLEGYAASVVDAPDGQCPASLTPVYRVYNKGFNRGITSNHRYATDTRIYDEMVRNGWAPEGVRFCVPPESSPVTTY